MTLLLQLLFVDLTVLICQVQSLHENLRCGYGANCAKAQDRQAKCPPGTYGKCFIHISKQSCVKRKSCYLVFSVMNGNSYIECI